MHPAELLLQEGIQKGPGGQASGEAPGRGSRDAANYLSCSRHSAETDGLLRVFPLVALTGLALPVSQYKSGGWQLLGQACQGILRESRVGPIQGSLILWSCILRTHLNASSWVLPTVLLDNRFPAALDRPLSSPAWWG